MHPSAPTTNSLRGDSRATAFAALILANCCLAFGPWLVRLADTGPVTAAFWRLTLALPLLALFAARAEGRKLPSRGAVWALLALSGLFFALDLGSWHLGIVRTKLANATLFGNSTSLIFPIYGFLVARAWPDRAQALALVLAGAGAALLLGRSYEASPDYLVGDLLCLLAGLLYTLYLIAMIRARRDLTAWPALAWSTLFGLLPLLALAGALGERFWPSDWTPLVLLALVSQIAGQGLMIYALDKFQPVVIGLALLVQPVIAGSIGWVIYGETLGPLDLVGAVLVAVALVLVRAPRGGAVEVAEKG